VYASSDGKEWGEPVAKGEFAPGRELKRVAFPHPVAAKFLKLVALSGFDDQPFASIAEFDVEQ
jgi:beta-galactosidase